MQSKSITRGVAIGVVLQPFKEDVAVVFLGFPERASSSLQQIPFSILELLYIISNQKMLN